MKIVTQTEVLGERLGEEQAIHVLCKAGFEGLDYSMFNMKDIDDYVLNTGDYKKHVLNLKKIADSYGVTFEQTHAPFPSARVGDEKYNNDIHEKIKRAIEITGLLDAKIVVVHPVYYKRNKFEKNMELYHSLEPYAKEYGVKIALENMFGRNEKRIIPNVCSVPREFNKYIDALDPRYFTACLDLGHCGLVGEDAANMILKMGGKRIGCLHVHDNDLINDNHTLPYTRNMDWDSILKALAKADYRGHFTYEADYFLTKMPTEILPDCAAFMAKLGRVMADKIDSYR